MSRLKTWSLEHWNIAAWILWKNINTNPTSPFINDYEAFKRDFRELSDLRGVAKQQVKAMEEKGII